MIRQHPVPWAPVVFTVALILLPLCAVAQHDSWVIDRVDETGVFIPGQWVPGSNAVQYDNYTWRLGDPYFTALPNNINAPTGWLRENFEFDRYNTQLYDNPFYEAESIHVTVNQTYYARRLDRDDQRMDTGEYRDAFTLYERERDWITIEVESRDFDPALIVLDTAGAYHRNDDFGNQNARVDFAIPREATTLVIVTSETPGETGRYQLTTLRHVGTIDEAVIERNFEVRRRQAERAAQRAAREQQSEAPPVEEPPVAEVVSEPISEEPPPPSPEIISTEDGEWRDTSGGTYSIQPVYP